VSKRQIIDLERDLWDAGIKVRLMVKGDGLQVEGEAYGDRMLAMSELRKRRIAVTGHKFRKAEK